MKAKFIGKMTTSTTLELWYTLDMGNELWRPLKANKPTIVDLLSTNEEDLEINP